ncbi:MAG: UDP-N-acetylmuramoyl-tripeptide--D-alanyl-D-alanine ligase [Rhodoferax sp.]|nr:UDP-N-acetylmuramoyl-tripeptide--D-alanyl-D-alanine ligase [Rhodoferax sp.]
MKPVKPMLPLFLATDWLDAAILYGDEQAAKQEVLRVHTDTRSMERGDLFLALKGDRFDANTLLHEACAHGAVALICHTGLPAAAYPEGVPRIMVRDTRAALAQLATGWRNEFRLPLIAVTGSNGKTTVTQMLACILHAAAGDAALATRGNLNNDIGVPLTVLRLREHHRLAVLELGMNHPGEIAALAQIARPTVALVNNAQREHLEFMHTVEAVAHENAAVIDALPSDGVAVFPADDRFTPLWTERAAGRKTVRFAMQPTASPDDLVCRSAVWQDGAWSVVAEGRHHGLHVRLNLRLAIAGRHNVKNALAAAACALAAGVSPQPIERGLRDFVPVKGRSRAMALTLQQGDQTCTFTLVDDSYNANPDSVHAAIDVLAELPGPRLLVLGDMGEVGKQGVAFHREAGEHAHANGIEHCFALGDLAGHAVAACPAARHFGSMDALLAALMEILPEVHSVLVKGSRFMHMERVVEALLALQVPPASKPPAPQPGKEAPPCC